MYQFEINKNEAGQRFDKYLHKLMPQAPSSFVYRMLRKKNIVLNGKKAEGKEKLNEGDVVKLFLSEETFQGFAEANHKTDAYLDAYKKLKGIEVLFENEHMLLLSKPSGILSQKATDSDVSVNEWLIGYLLAQEKIVQESLATYRPSVCNRLDRNTSGLVICGRTLAGSQELNYLIKERMIRKFYRLFVMGRLEREETIEGYLKKEPSGNQVTVSSAASEGASYIRTRYYPVKILNDMTYLEVELITGKPHQIRAHMASIGHPVLGDGKYGNMDFNRKYKEKYGINSQMLHAYRLEFPANQLLFGGEAASFTAKEPEAFDRILGRN